MGDIIYFDRPNGKHGGFNMSYCQKPFYFTFPEKLFDLGRVRVSFANKAFVACKAAFFGDEDCYLKIMSSKAPSEVNTLSKNISDFDEDTLDNSFREEFLFEVLKAKFDSNQRLKTELLGTGDKIIAYANLDTIYGIGLRIEEVGVEECCWRGQNVLGSCLMQVRTFLRDSDFLS